MYKDDYKLFPCPFCGYDNPRISDKKSQFFIGYRVSCMNLDCVAHGPIALSIEEAVNLWNKRWFSHSIMREIWNKNE
jgi:hypothetical protein